MSLEPIPTVCYAFRWLVIVWLLYIGIHLVVGLHPFGFLLGNLLVGVGSIILAIRLLYNGFAGRVTEEVAVWWGLGLVVFLALFVIPWLWGGLNFWFEYKEFPSYMEWNYGKDKVFHVYERNIWN